MGKQSFYGGGLAASTYDLFDVRGSVQGDVAFYLECARRFGSPVLELAAGTGRILIPMAEASFRATGVEPSRAMLDRARDKLRALPPEVGELVELVQGDMQSFSLDRRFPLALIPYRSFQLLTEPSDQRAALRRIHDHLEPGGRLVVDLFDPRLEFCLSDSPHMEPVLETHDPLTGHAVRRTVVARSADPFRQRISERQRLEVIDADGAIIAAEEGEFSLRWTLRQEMAYLFELTGFEVVESHGDFKGSPPAYGREQIWIVRAASRTSAREP